MGMALEALEMCKLFNCNFSKLQPSLTALLQEQHACVRVGGCHAEPPSPGGWLYVHMSTFQQSPNYSTESQLQQNPNCSKTPPAQCSSRPH